MEQPLDTAKLVNDYLTRFHKHYKIPRHFEEESELLAWMGTTGKQYRDWTYYKGHPKDPHCSLSILDPKWCTLFELNWGHLIMGTIDIRSKF